MGGTTSSEGFEARDFPDRSGPSFKPAKNLGQKDFMLCDMLSGNDHRGLCYVVTDPQLPDNPIVFASEGFCKNTGYAKEDIEGRNCRFLQGKETDPSDVEKIRKALDTETEISLCLLNYRKDGSVFHNQFFLCPLREASGKTAYFLGVQVEVPVAAPGQQIMNPGWVYSMGLPA
ncbi:unnamed protein product [Phaeothamnion confervicola]